MSAVKYGLMLSSEMHGVLQAAVLRALKDGRMAVTDERHPPAVRDAWSRSVKMLDQVQEGLDLIGQQFYADSLNESNPNG